MGAQRAKRPAGGLQTLVFAVITDAGTAQRGITDAFALYRCMPGAVPGGTLPPVLTVAKPTGHGDGLVAFLDEGMAPASQGHPVYVRKLFSTQPHDAADPARARRMHLPPV